MGKSSKDKRDAYYRLAKEQGWRARSAFKLLQIDEEFDLFKNVTRVVDLCAAPGSWSQVLSRVLINGEKFGRQAWEDERARDKLTGFDIEPRPASFNHMRPRTDEVTSEAPKKDVKIVAIDLQPMSPLEGVTTMTADITHPSTIPRLLNALDPDHDPNSSSATHPVDLVISDGAPDVTGLHDLDVYVQSQLLWAALNLALCVLRPGGSFVAKIFRVKDVDLLYAQLKIVFTQVTVAKPRSSRASSLEAFIVCRDFRPPEGFKASLEQPLQGGDLFPASDQAEDAMKADDEQTLNEGDVGKKPQSKPEEEPNKEIKRINRSGGIQDIYFEAQARNTKWIAPFLACGDLSSWDSEATYKLPKDRISLDPVQPPTAPPYKKALENRRLYGENYGRDRPNAI